MVSAHDLGRSLRGAAALVGRRSDALAAFDISLPGLVRSFGAFGLMLPAMAVSLGLERMRLGLDVRGSALLDHRGLIAAVGLAHLASFMALPIAMIALAPRLGLSARYAPFVIVTNWLSALGSLALAIPGALLLCGVEPLAFSVLLTLAFGVILLQAQVFAARVTLDVDVSLAITITALGLLLDMTIARLLEGLTG